MIRELKYFFYILTIIFFIFFVGNYYFSEKNIKNSYRSINLFEKKIIKYGNNLKILDSDTKNIIKYLETSISKDEKKYKFWELITNNEK